MTARSLLVNAINGATGPHAPPSLRTKAVRDRWPDSQYRDFVMQLMLYFNANPARRPICNPEKVLSMIDLGRQASLNGRLFETLADAIAAKEPNDAQAIIGLDADAVSGEPAPPDLFHDEIEKIRASKEFRDYRIFADPSQPAIVQNGENTTRYYTLDEAVRGWQALPAAQRAKSTIKIGSSIYNASQINRLHIK
jgi:hypothetical protein